MNLLNAKPNGPGLFHMYAVFPCSSEITLNCRIHQVTASMTTIDLIINIGQDVLESVTALVKLAAPSLSSCALSIYFSQFYLCYCLVRIRC